MMSKHKELFSEHQEIKKRIRAFYAQKDTEKTSLLRQEVGLMEFIKIRFSNSRVYVCICVYMCVCVCVCVITFFLQQNVIPKINANKKN